MRVGALESPSPPASPCPRSWRLSPCFHPPSSFPPAIRPSLLGSPHPTPGALVPVWALTQRREPGLGKPRRTGRRSSFYRPSNWGWSRRGNTKILCTQLLSVRAGMGSRRIQAARDTFALCVRAPSPTPAFNRRTRTLDMGEGRVSRADEPEDWDEEH